MAEEVNHRIRVGEGPSFLFHCSDEDLACEVDLVPGERGVGESIV